MNSKVTAIDVRLMIRNICHRSPEPGKIVIIGDRPSPGTPVDSKHPPFCGNKSSSKWLNEQLCQAGVPEEELRWLNAVKADGNRTQYCELYQLLPAKIVIALGVNASAWLSAAGVDHVRLPHPQYWKRFRSKEERYPLLEVLERNIAWPLANQ